MRGTGDPNALLSARACSEGLISTLPCTAQVLLELSASTRWGRASVIRLNLQNKLGGLRKNTFEFLQCKAKPGGRQQPPCSVQQVAASDQESQDQLPGRCPGK